MISRSKVASPPDIRAMQPDEIGERYRALWAKFADDCAALYADVRTFARENGGQLHTVLRKCQPVPYDEAPKMARGETGESSRQNIGSVTGLFFEMLATSLVLGYVEERVPAVSSHRNRCDIEDIAAVTRDPDLVLHHDGRAVVLEFKASPKSAALVRARKHRDEYRVLHVPYFLIGGHVSARLNELRTIASEDWACFTSASDGNASALHAMPPLDKLLADAVEHLLRGPRYRSGGDGPVTL